MEVTGLIHLIGSEQQVSDSFRKRELVLKTEEQYPQFISIGFVQDKCDLLNGYKLGQNVTVSINLRGREWTNPQGEVKYFNDIQGWKVSTNTDANNVDVKEPKTVFEPSVVATEENDLPF